MNSWDRSEGARLLKEENRFLLELLDISENGLLVCDKEGQITYFNQTLLDLLRVKEENMGSIGDELNPETISGGFANRACFLSWFHATRRENPSQLLIETKEGEELLCKCKRLYDREGLEAGRAWVFTRVCQLRDSKGVLGGCSDKKNYQKTLTKMAASIAHRLNNVLTAVQGHLELAKMRLEAGSPPLANIEMAECALARVADIGREMLFYSGGGRLDSCLVDMNDMVSDVLASLGKSIPPWIHVKFSPSSEPATVCADRDKIQRILVCLIKNALEAIKAPNGEIELMVRTRHTLPTRPNETKEIVLEIKDNGRGMDQETLEHVFDPFFSTKMIGHGMSMATVKGIVEAHNGSIEIDSTPGMGTVVTVVLPENTDCPILPTPNTPI